MITRDTQDHERIEELLAGYVLRSLSGEDAAEADRLLSDHVPACPACRDTLTAFQDLSADLALDAPPVAPPEPLLPRLHRELESSDRRRRPMQVFAVAAGVVAVVGLAGLAFTQGVRADNANARAADFRAALEMAQRPDADLVPVGQGPVREISAPGEERFFLAGSNVPDPTPGMTYRVWLVAGTEATWAGDFVPDDGEVFLPISLDASAFDQLLITQEPAGSTPTAPGQPQWSSTG